MPEELVLVGQNVMFMTAETRDKLLARPDLKMASAPPRDGGFVGWELDGVRVEILTEEELREKAKGAKPAPERAPAAHPRALSREAIRRRGQMARRAARKQAAEMGAADA